MQIVNAFDFMLMPTAPTTGFKIRENSDDPITIYLQDIFTVHANLAGIPAISLPKWTHSNGMPFGMQLMGAKNEDVKLLRFSAELMHKEN